MKWKDNLFLRFRGATDSMNWIPSICPDHLGNRCRVIVQYKIRLSETEKITVFKVKAEYILVQQDHPGCSSHDCSLVNCIQEHISDMPIVGFTKHRFHRPTIPTGEGIHYYVMGI